MKKKILITATTDIHLKNFHIPYIKLLTDFGYEVHVACKGDTKIEYADKQFNINFQRKPLDKRNYIAFKQLKQLIDNNNYILIHCHTPICSFITRVAAIKSRRNGTYVLYTAHGFHFYKGALIRNWLLFFPIEVLLSNITDGIITMNLEDFNRLKTPVFRCKDKYFIDGIGINPARLLYENTELLDLKSQFGIENDDVVVLYIAEFIPRKNHQFIFDQIKAIADEFPKIKYLFCGGFSSEKTQLEKQAIKDGFIDKVKFLGYQNDIGKIIALADIGISASKAEGLPIGVLELMYNKLPVIASNIRGHKDIIKDAENSYLFDLNQDVVFKRTLLMLCRNENVRIEMGNKAKQSIEKFLLPKVLEKMSTIYNDLLGHQHSRLYRKNEASQKS